VCWSISSPFLGWSSGRIDGPDHDVEINVKGLTNEQMIKMMANENMEEWGSSGWIELETVKSVVEAAGKGLIELPPMRTGGRKSKLTPAAGVSPVTVAEFLGWTRKTNKDGVRPNFACETAFYAMDAVN
jgi:hypothetical protein